MTASGITARTRSDEAAEFLDSAAASSDMGHTAEWAQVKALVGIGHALLALDGGLERQSVEVVDAINDLRSEIYGGLSELAEVAEALNAEVLPRWSWWDRVRSVFGRSAPYVEEFPEAIRGESAEVDAAPGRGV